MHDGAAGSEDLSLLDRQESIPAVIFLVLLMYCLTSALWTICFGVLSPRATQLAFRASPPLTPPPPPHIHKEKLGEEVKTEEKQLVHGKERGKSLSPGHGIKDNGYNLRDSHTGFPRSPRVMRSPLGTEKACCEAPGFPGPENGVEDGQPDPHGPGSAFQCAGPFLSS